MIENKEKKKKNMEYNSLEAAPLPMPLTKNARPRR